MNNYEKMNSVLMGATAAPPRLDRLEMDYQGVKLHVYGVFHGITGGTNQDYIQFVNNTIAKTDGAKLCEKSMRQIYEGLDQDVYDWAQIPAKDAFRFAFCAMINPRFLFLMGRTIYREKKTEFSRFGANDVFLPGDVSGDRRVHGIHPIDRRQLAGFPTSEQYAKLNLMRRAGAVKGRLHFVDPDWHWLSYVEPYANIPLRSIHMVEYAVAYAKKHGHDTVSLFVGETHNSDIAWYVEERRTSTLPTWLEEPAQAVTETAQAMVDGKVLWPQIKYLASLAAGGLAAGAVYVAAIQGVLAL